LAGNALAAQNGRTPHHANLVPGLMAHGAAGAPAPYRGSAMATRVSGIRITPRPERAGVPRGGGQSPACDARPGGPRQVRPQALRSGHGVGDRGGAHVRKRGVSRDARLPDGERARNLPPWKRHFPTPRSSPVVAPATRAPGPSWSTASRAMCTRSLRRASACGQTTPRTSFRRSSRGRSSTSSAYGTTRQSAPGSPSSHGGSRSTASAPARASS